MLDEGDPNTVRVAHVHHLICQDLAQLHRVAQGRAHLRERAHLVWHERELNWQHDRGHLALAREVLDAARALEPSEERKGRGARE